MVSDNGELSCLDAKSGSVRWSEGLERKFSASLLHAGGLIYAMAEDGTGFVFRSGPKYDSVSVNRLGE